MDKMSSLFSTVKNEAKISQKRSMPVMLFGARVCALVILTWSSGIKIEHIEQMQAQLSIIISMYPCLCLIIFIPSGV